MKDNFFDGLEDAKESIKTRFVNCGREANDLEKGCPYCDNLKEYNTEKFNMRLEYIMREKNTISNILKYRLGNCWIRFYPWFYIRKKSIWWNRIWFVNNYMVNLWWHITRNICPSGNNTNITHIRFKVWIKNKNGK